VSNAGKTGNIGRTPDPKRVRALDKRFDKGVSGITHFVYNGIIVLKPFFQNELCTVAGLKLDRLVNTLRSEYDTIMLPKTVPCATGYVYKAHIQGNELTFNLREYKEGGVLAPDDLHADRTWMKGHISASQFGLFPMDLVHWGIRSKQSKEFWNNCIRLARVLIENKLPGTLILDKNTAQLLDEVHEIMVKKSKPKTLQDLAQLTLFKIKDTPA
jgi:hypothetical protein